MAINVSLLRAGLKRASFERRFYILTFCNVSFQAKKMCRNWAVIVKREHFLLFKHKIRTGGFSNIPITRAMVMGIPDPLRK